MRKIIWIIISIFLFSLSGCGGDTSSEVSETPNTQRPSIMLDGILYYTTGNEVEENDINFESIDYVDSVIHGSTLPTNDGEINFPCENAPYTKLENGVAIKIDDAWILFEPDES
ncbi:MAG: hypothetical protein MJB12_02065 [Firmicutes bacterium]|nr:hypothetical protein [Bacillota bacterium]